MKSMILVAVAFVAVAVAAPTEPPQTLKSEFNSSPEGGYVYSFETENGIVRSETGELKEALDEDNKPHQVVVMRGSYSYFDAEGKPHSVTYVANDQGYKAESDDIPKVPVARR